MKVQTSKRDSSKSQTPGKIKERLISLVADDLICIVGVGTATVWQMNHVKTCFILYYLG